MKLRKCHTIALSHCHIAIIPQYHNGRMGEKQMRPKILKCRLRDRKEHGNLGVLSD